MAKLSVPMLTDPAYGSAAGTPQRRMAAACQVLELAEVTHRRPPWNILSVMSEGREMAITEEETLVTPFATLRRFRKSSAATQPPV
ncbi:MAG: polyhydroxyalkanoate depolymerase, partial [Caldimonas sp.]